MRKASSYDFVGTGESLGTGPNSQSITSKLMPATVPPPKKPTPKEYQAQIKQLSKRIKRNEQKHQRHHNMFVAKLKMKDEAAVKLNQTLARNKEQFTAKMKMKDESVLKLNHLLARKKAQVVDLSNKLKVNHFFTLRCTVLKLTLIRWISLPACRIN